MENITKIRDKEKLLKHKFEGKLFCKSKCGIIKNWERFHL